MCVFSCSLIKGFEAAFVSSALSRYSACACVDVCRQERVPRFFFALSSLSSNPPL